MLSTSVFLAAAMQCAASIHPSTALDVARVESGLNPYAIAEILPGGKGVISHFPASRNETISLAGRLYPVFDDVALRVRCRGAYFLPDQ